MIDSFLSIDAGLCKRLNIALVVKLPLYLIRYLN